MRAPGASDHAFGQVLISPLGTLDTGTRWRNSSFLHAKGAANIDWRRHLRRLKEINLIQSIKRIADATPKGKFETKTGQVKDRTVVHSAVVVAAMSLPAGPIRNSMQMTTVNKDCDHREALLGSVVDTEVSKLVNKVSQAAVETGCVPLHAHMAASVAFGAPYRKALDVSRAGAVNTLRVALDKAWDGALPFAPAGGAGVDDGSDDDDPEDDDEDEEGSEE